MHTAKVAAAYDKQHYCAGRDGYNNAFCKSPRDTTRVAASRCI